MKRFLFLLFIPLAFGLFFFGKKAHYSTKYLPVLMDKEELKQSIKSVAAQPLKRPGKMYLREPYIFINEKYKGVHIINNLDPKNPQNVGFIAIPGCIDMAVKGNYLYADNAIDLVTIDISDVFNVKEVHRISNLFPEHIPPNETYIPEQFQEGNRIKNTVIVEWILNTEY